MLTVDLDRLGLKPRRLAARRRLRRRAPLLRRARHAAPTSWDSTSTSRASQTRATGISRSASGDGRPPHGGVCRATCSALPFPDGRFDRVICSEVMEHVHDYGSGPSRELTRVLRPGGTHRDHDSDRDHRAPVPAPLTRDYFESPGGHIRIFRRARSPRAMARAGLASTACGFAHALHSPYWAAALRWYGLHDENPAPTRAYRQLPDARQPRASLDVGSSTLLDWVWPKSLILYGTRRASGSA